jgi:hypothetical protein
VGFAIFLITSDLSEEGQSQDDTGAYCAQLPACGVMEERHDYGEPAGQLRSIGKMNHRPPADTDFLGSDV